MRMKALLPPNHLLLLLVFRIDWKRCDSGCGSYKRRHCSVLSSVLPLRYRIRVSLCHFIFLWLILCAGDIAVAWIPSLWPLYPVPWRASVLPFSLSPFGNTWKQCQDKFIRYMFSVYKSPLLLPLPLSLSLSSSSLTHFYVVVSVICLYM